MQTLYSPARTQQPVTGL